MYISGRPQMFPLQLLLYVTLPYTIYVANLAVIVIWELDAFS